MSAGGGAGATEAELRAALFDVGAQAMTTHEAARRYVLLQEAITELVALRQALAPVPDDYPSAVFKELWRVLKELRAATGENRRCRQGDDD